MLVKRTIPLILAASIGFLLIATYFIPSTEQWGATAMEMFIILSAGAMVLGAGNLIMLNLSKISNKNPGWAYGAITLIAFFITLIIGIFKIGALPTMTAPDNPWTAPLVGQPGVPFWWIYSYVYKPLTATMFAMLAFYIASAAFRAFRAKNIEATLLLGTAFIVLLGQIYAGVWLTSFLPDIGSVDGLARYVASFPEASQEFARAIALQVQSGVTLDNFTFEGVSYASMSLDQQAMAIEMSQYLNGWWYQLLNGLRLENLTQIILDVPQKAGNRAIMIGIALGIVSVSLKVLLGIDRSYLGSED
ncbi:MAG: hypothetical protein CMJ40_00365 [Phycisphaerae bacterium]|nr:hypothetical protein [Phycisphaerae bacterium]